MRLASENISKLEIVLDEAQSEGWGWIGYSNDNEFFNSTTIKIFHEKDQAIEYGIENTGKSHYAIAPLEPVLEAIKLISSQFLVFEGQKEIRSIPLDILQILKDYNLKTEIKTTIMEENNLAYLEKRLLVVGMGEIPRTELVEKMAEGKESFQLSLEKKYGNDIAVAIPFLKRSEQGKYFFNSYDMVVHQEGKDPIRQTFKVRNSDPVNVKNEETGEEKKEWINSTITFKEAYNQIKGRSVCKDYVKVDKDAPENNKKYNAWEYLDFTKPDEKGNYPAGKVYNIELEKLLSDYPIKELATDKYKEDLLASLKRGNCQQVNFEKDSTTEKMYIEANPRFGAIKIYNQNMAPVSLSMKIKKVAPESQGQQTGQAQSEGEKSGKDSKQSEKVEAVDGGDDDTTGKKNKRTRRKTNGVS